MKVIQSWYSIGKIAEDALRMLVTGLLHVGWAIVLLMVKTAATGFKLAEKAWQRTEEKPRRNST